MERFCSDIYLWMVSLGIITWGVATPCHSSGLVPSLRAGPGIWFFRSSHVVLKISSCERSWKCPLSQALLALGNFIHQISG